MEIKVYDVLPESAAVIRTAVFVEEQGFVNEMDDTDGVATHFVMYDEGEPAATCRVFWSDEKEAWILGRLAVMKPYRGKKLGAKLLERAEEYVREREGRRMALHAQCRAADFYRKQGFEEKGPVEEDEGCPHIWMYKEL